MSEDPVEPGAKQPDPANLPSERDRLFVDAPPGPGEFRFDEAVARVFPDMLRRSIPGYSALLQLIGVLASETVQSGTHVYDLGCSLGAVSLAIRHAIGERDATLVAVDNSTAMVQRCRSVMDADSSPCKVEVIQGDISQLELKTSSLVVLNFTLQFAPVTERPRILRAIGEALVPGGVLVLSEKTRPESDDADSFFSNMHDGFRRANGYSQLEMSRKREALLRVLVPQATTTYEKMLEDAGLVPLEWFRCLHFVSWVGQKPS